MRCQPYQTSWVRQPRDSSVTPTFRRASTTLHTRVSGRRFSSGSPRPETCSANSRRRCPDPCARCSNYLLAEDSSSLTEANVTLLFRLSNLLVLPFWALMILLPRWRWTACILRSPFVSAAPALLYAALVLPRLDTIWPAIARPTLNGVAALLGSPEGATIAWVHFLAFDLFVGRWIFLDSQERRLSPLLMAPVLFLTLMLGPFGFLIYLVLRALAISREASKGSTETSLTRGDSNQPSTKRTSLGLQTQDPKMTLLQRAWRTNRPLTILGVAMILVI